MAILCTIAWVVLAVIFMPYLMHHVLLGFCKGRDLKKRYNAEWALVTGASSGAPQLHAPFPVPAPVNYQIMMLGMHFSTACSSDHDILDNLRHDQQHGLFAAAQASASRSPGSCWTRASTWCWWRCRLASCCADPHTCCSSLPMLRISWRRLTSEHAAATAALGGISLIPVWIRCRTPCSTQPHGSSRRPFPRASCGRCCPPLLLFWSGNLRDMSCWQIAHDCIAANDI